MEALGRLDTLLREKIKNRYGYLYGIVNIIKDKNHGSTKDLIEQTTQHSTYNFRMFENFTPPHYHYVYIPYV